MPSLQLTLNSRRPIDLTGRRQKEVLRRVANALNAELAGAGPIIEDFLVQSDANLLDGDDGGCLGRAAGVVVFSSASGTLNIVIDGTAVATTFDTSDTESASDAVANINANATVSPFVTATKYVGQMTLASVTAGTTVDVCGYTSTATAADTNKPQQFSISGNDTADALALVQAINTTPGLCSKVRAVSVAAVVYVGLVENRAARSDELLVAGASTVTVNAQITTGGRLMVVARTPGLIGNCCTLTGSGTGVTASSNNSGKLGGGTGGRPSSLGVYLSQDTR